MNTTTKNETVDFGNLRAFIYDFDNESVFVRVEYAESKKLITNVKCSKPSRKISTESCLMSAVKYALNYAM